jgi:anti-sigma factor RsiW
MGRPFDKHIDEPELEALTSWYAHEHRDDDIALPPWIREIEWHLSSCAECRRRKSQYLQFVNQSLAAGSPAGNRKPDCPVEIDWHEVAAGLWPELRTRQLIKHAAQCEHCGPLLRAAAPTAEPTAREEEFLGRLKAPLRPAPQGIKNTPPVNHSSRRWRRLMDWKVLVPATALLVLVAALTAGRLSSSAPLSGAGFAEFAARTHNQHVRGNLALELQTDSQPALNAWLHENSQFALALPASSEMPGEQLPYRIEGGRLIGIRNRTAAYIAYQMQSGHVSLIVTPMSVAIASGGVDAAFNKVNFHYYTIQGYKVVTWSVHGLTYALVSQEGNSTQVSCMVCHSAMRDRDLSQTPTPLADPKATSQPFLQ